MTILVASGDDKLAKQRLAQLVKELRGKATQREFARMLGTSYTAVQDWEKQVRLPKGENLERIAQLKGWTQAELLSYLFLSDTQSQIIASNSFEIILSHLQNLSPCEIRKLSDRLNDKLSKVQQEQEKPMRCFLNEKQKHNLHLLLKASLKHQSPTEAIAQTAIDPALFTDIFLRGDTNRVVDYEALEQLSSLCYRVVQWRMGQIPEIDHSQTYAGKTAVLFNDLAEGGKLTID